MSRRPTMVFPGKIWTGSCEDALVNGFRSLGWGVQDISIASFTGKSVGGTMGKVGYRMFRPSALAAFRADIIEQCRLARPDWLFIVKGTGIDVATLKTVRAMGIKVANYYPDLNFDHALFDVAIIDECDIFFTPKIFHLPWMQENYPAVPTHFIQQAYSQTAHAPTYNVMREEDYLCDVLYLGTRSDYKHQLMEDLIALIPDVDVKIAGSYWPGRVEGTPLEGKLFNGIPFNCVYSELLQRARINVAFHFGPDKNGWNDMVSARTFEIPACGGFMIHIDNEETRASFVADQECALFTDVADLAAKIRHYLANPAERLAILAAGQRRAEAEHSFRHRAEAMSQLLLAS